MTTITLQRIRQSALSPNIGFKLIHVTAREHLQVCRSCLIPRLYPCGLGTRLAGVSLIPRLHPCGLAMRLVGVSLIPRLHPCGLGKRLAGVSLIPRLHPCGLGTRLCRSKPLKPNLQLHSPAPLVICVCCSMYCCPPGWSDWPWL